MRFRSQVHDVRNAMLLDDLQDGGLVTQVHFLEGVFRMAVDLFQVRQVAGIGKEVEVDKPLHFRPVNDVVDEVGADKPGSASDEQFHEINNKATKQLAIRSTS